MAENPVGTIPEFTENESLESAEVKQQETETLTETSTEQKPVDETTSQVSEDTRDTKLTEDIASKEAELKAVQGIKEEREKLLIEISELRKERRNLREQKVEEVKTEVADTLDDIRPEDRAIFERVIKAGGYITKSELEKRVFEETKQEALDNFLTKYPEYKPDNDPNDLNWNSLNRELKDYVLPKTKDGIVRILEKARKNIFSAPSDQITIKANKQKMETASIGSKNSISRSSSSKSLTQSEREAYSRGGWTEEEIKEIEIKL